MKKYTLKELKNELEALNYREEMQKPEDKIFYIIDTITGQKILKVNQRSELVTLAHYLEPRAIKQEDMELDKKYINLQNLGDYPRYFVEKQDDEEIYIIYPTEEKEQDIKNAIDYVLNFSRNLSKKFYYMIEWGNGYTEQDAAIYNYLAYFHRELIENKEQPSAEQLKIFWTVNEIEPFYNEQVKADIKKERKSLEQQKEYVDAFMKIFNTCLDFNIDLQLHYEKPNGINEQRALKIIDQVGGYNDFTPGEFLKLIEYCNSHFIKYYNKGNPNNYMKDYRISFGREGSILEYLTITTKTEEEAQSHLQALKNLLKADELDIIDGGYGYFGYNAKIRLWYD